MSSRSIAEHDLAAPPAAILPKCQYCQADPALIVPAFIAMAGARAIVFACATCRSVFSVQLTGVDQPAPRRVVLPQ